MDIAIVELRTTRGVGAGSVRIVSAGRRAKGASARGVVENGDYQFFVDGEVVALGPAELFSADAEPDGSGSVARGRFRPGNFVGTVEVRAESRNGEVLTGWLEVRSRKLDFESQYRWMLSGVAEDGAELLLRSFSPAQLALQADHARSPRALYQQVAFLAAIIRRPHTVEAVERVLRQPYVSYRANPIEHPVGRGLSGSSRTVRALTEPGPRQPARPGLSVSTLPVTVRDLRHEATIDNVANRYVRFVLDHWAAVLDRAATAITGDAPAARRGRREIGSLLDTVDGWRTDPRFADVGTLRTAPGGNQAVHRRPGYREVHQAFVESQAAAMLTWDGGDDLHRAGQQDIAQLYEYWCYLELRRIVERHCVLASSTELVEVSDDGMHLRLKRGRQQVIEGHLVHHGRMIDIELWFNRSFGAAESWTLQMRPDCSIRFSAQVGSGGRVSTWLHLDAKYRIDTAGELFVGDDDLSDDAADERTTSRKAKRADLLKMHAYHDAIRSSAGSYVLFPGSEPLRRKKYDEVLPGLGAIPFVPSSDGHATDASAGAVETLFLEVLDHIAHQASSRERATWWEGEANRSTPGASGLFVPLDRPPADVTVLIGYCRSEEHRRWVEDAGLYNLRFEAERRGTVARSGAEAAAETLLLWCRDSDEVRAWTLTDHLTEADADELRRRGYPGEPTGRYLLRTLNQPFEIPPELDRTTIERLTRHGLLGAPLATDWATILAG